MSILMAILVFGIVVLVHEWGHFIAARKVGIWVEEFAIGMGPKLVGIQSGETLYTIRLLPLGGFCKLYADDADALTSKEESDEKLQADPTLSEKAYCNKTIPQRAMVMVAGSFMNFVLAFVLFSLVASIAGINTTIVGGTVDESPAQLVGLNAGDRITHLNGNRIFLWDDIAFETATGGGRPIEIGYIRDGFSHNVIITPQNMDGRYAIGIYSTPRAGLLSPFNAPTEGLQTATIGETLTDGFMRIGFVVRSIVFTLVRLVTAPSTVVDQIAGPIGIGNMIHGQYQATVQAATNAQVSFGILALSIFLNMASFGALISANLGVMNLLPLPALDGGRLLFLTVEAVRRKPISPEREGIIHLAGFVILMILAVFIAYQDILNLI
ncbi:MAG: site-2 protease family protein [Firmicutes bacterium]|nr:site-2 protease family protein [Bacillota bacterium]